MTNDETITPLQHDRRTLRGLSFIAAIKRTDLAWRQLERQWFEFVTSGGMVSGVIQ